MLELTKGVALHAFETRGDRHRSAGRIGLLAAALCASAAPAWAATFYVRTSGNDAQNGRNPATAFASIRRANAACTRSRQRKTMRLATPACG